MTRTAAASRSMRTDTGRVAEALEHQADKAADEAVRTGAVALDPMSAAERQDVHEYSATGRTSSTHSEGEGAERRLVVSPAD